MLHFIPKQSAFHFGKLSRADSRIRNDQFEKLVTLHGFAHHCINLQWILTTDFCSDNAEVQLYKRVGRQINCLRNNELIQSIEG